jgi:hypothetical protein
MDFINFFKYIFPFAFIGSWLLVSFILSRMGWATLATNYPFDGVFTGQRIGIISGSINSVNYNNSIILKYNDEGLYLKPIVLFRLFHKPILIPWKEIKSVRDKQMLLFTVKELNVGDPFVARIGISEGAFDKIKRHIYQRSL